MASYTYTAGDTKALNRLRFLLGDHRGTVGVATGWLFSDDELGDTLVLAFGTHTPNAATPSLDTSGYGISLAARMCLQCRANREAMAAGVAGTTDTTDRPAALINALRALNALNYPGSVANLPLNQPREAEIAGLSGDDTP